MTKNTACRLLLMSLLASGSGLSCAEDIDIYSANTSITPGAPNVLIILDNTANWSQSFASSTKFAAEKVALAQVINALKSQFNLGLMLYTETGSPNTPTDGGYVRFAIQGMTDASGNPTNARNCLLTMVGATPSPACTSPGSAYYTNLDINNDKSNGGKAGKTMGEAYDYFAGLNAYAGNNKVKADPLAFTSNSIAGPTYRSPIADGTCQKNFIIVISNGPFQDNSSDTATAMSQLGSAGGDTGIINPPDTGSNNNAGDEWTRFLNKVSTVNAVTYTLEVGPSTTGQGPYNTALLQSMGRQGKGGYYSAIDAATLNAALTRIINDIQAVNSVFASSSLPLSADNTGNFANQVYMAVFRPDGQGLPRWLGNLKEYQFGVDSNGNLFLADANGVAAASSTSGFAQSAAQSFWTSMNPSAAPDAPAAPATDALTGSTGGFWYYDAKGDGGSFDLPDGEWVEKGGAAQQLRLTYLGYGGRGGIGDLNTSTLNSKPARQVYTCTGGCRTSGTLLSLTPFDTSNSTITGDPAAFNVNPAAVTVSSISSDRIVATVTAGSALPAVQTLSATSTLVTVTTQKNHNLPGGTSYVTIDGSSIVGTNGTFLVTNTGNKTFTYAVSGVTAGTSSGTPTATAASTTATVSTTVSHGFSNGLSVNIKGASCSVSSPGTCAFNGTGYSVKNKTATTFQITLPSPVGATANNSGTLASTFIARVTTTSAHGFSTGDSVTIGNADCSAQGFDCSGYNTTANIFNLSPTTFDYLYTATSPLAVATNSGITVVDNTPSGTALANMLKWVRGQDTQDENGFKVAGADTDVRASIHGDILHSRPVVLNYAPTGSATNNIYLFYGGNDGVFRAIKGGQAASDGGEQWAFIPQEFYGILKRQYDNSPPVLYPSTPASANATRRNYAWDGPVVAYVQRDSGGNILTANLYLSVRRGGRFIYALDVKNPTNPKFLWRKGCSTAGGVTTCDAGFDELAETWSSPAVAKVQAHTNPVLIFGGGYDAASEDPEPPAMADTVGRAVFVVDALDGSLVWSAGKSGTTVTVSGMDFSVAADVLAVDRRQTGFIDRAYAADVGGNVWRIDLGGTDTSGWAVWKIAAVGGRTSSSAGRKFLFGPDVVFGPDGTFDAVVIGSGDREHPLATNAANSVENRAYMFMDTQQGTTGADLNITESDLVNIGVTSGSTAVDLTGKKGWSVTLRDGEKVVNGPIVVASDMIFGTNQPCASGLTNDSGECVTSSGSNLSCSGNLGIARRYDINFLTAAPAGFTDSSGSPARWELAGKGGGFLPSPVAGVVEINGVNYPFITDNPLSPGGVINPVINVSNKRFRTYWHQLIE